MDKNEPNLKMDDPFQPQVYYYTNFSFFFLYYTWAVLKFSRKSDFPFEKQFFAIDTWESGEFQYSSI